MKLLLRYLKRYKWLVLLALVLAAINRVFSMLDPAILRFIIDKYAVPIREDPTAFTPREFFTGVGLLFAAAVGVALVSRIAKNFQDYYLNVITQRVGVNIYSDGIRHSLEMPYVVFEDQQSGETLGKLTKLRNDVEKLMTNMVNVVFMSLVGIVFVVIFSIFVHWLMAPVFLMAIPLVVVLSLVLSRRIKRIQKVITAQTTALAGSTTESLRNIELVKSLGLAQQEIERLNTTTDKILGLELTKVRYIRSLSFIQGTCINLLRTSVMILMMYLIFTQQIKVGEFLALFIYSFFIFGPLQELGTVINTYREAEASLDNFQEILSQPKEPKPTSPKAIETVGSIEFSDVDFQYPSAASKALSGMSFRVDLGETVAFVGPSGSGKTTLVKLLVGLYTPEAGDILINGLSLSEIDLDQLREKIGLVTQDTHLFSGTLRENLLFVNPGASDEDCLHVLEMAACQRLLDRADQGLDTVIGEGGIKVSGGEKQRISIARALLRNPALLVFDEATSSLDSLTEEEITETIREISRRKDIITIMIAHRLSTVMHADRIFVLERGEIVESGEHVDLVERHGLYYAMWRQQIGERQAEASTETVADASGW